MEVLTHLIAVCFFILLFLFCAKNNEKQPNNLNYYIGISSVLCVLILTANLLLTIIDSIC